MGGWSVPKPDIFLVCCLSVGIDKYTIQMRKNSWEIHYTNVLKKIQYKLTLPSTRRNDREKLAIRVEKKNYAGIYCPRGKNAYK